MNTLPLHFGFSDARDILQKAGRDRDRIIRAHEPGSPQGAIADAVFDFAVTAFHIKDWLQSSHPSLCGDVETFLANDTRLMGVCRHLCNGSKHVLLTKDQKSEAASIQSGDLKADSDLITTDSSRSTTAPLVTIRLLDGTNLEIVSFANDVIKAWEAYFLSHNIP